MPKLGRIICLLCFIASGNVSSALDCQTGFLADGSIWKTEYYIIDAQKPGPVVLITGGIHGNEPAGARAAEHVRFWPLKCGKLIVIPRVNKPGLEKGTRAMPSIPKEFANLNRNFPKKDKPACACKLSRIIWQWVCRQQPDWLLDLHEGFDFTQNNGKSVGSSIIAAPLPPTLTQAQSMIDAVNKTIESAPQKFVLKKPPVNGSLARAASEKLRVHAMILETTKKDQPLSLRIRQHRIMVHQLLTNLGMIDCDVDSLVNSLHPGKNRWVALYDAGGAGASGPLALEKDLGMLNDVVVRRIGIPEIQNGSLRQFDALIVPGGSASKQAQALGNKGRDAVVEFVKNGGGYLGFCAGAYLAANNYSWSLKILDADVIDRQHWKRGKGTVKIELTPAGRKLLRDRKDLLDIRYANGPLLAPAQDPDIPDFLTLAAYRSEINTNNAPEGIMKNTPAIVVGQFGCGRVFCASCHPEYTKGLEVFVHRALDWVTRKTSLPP